MLLNILSTTIMTTGFIVAFSHAALPTHWLPFVLASQGQKWSKAKTLSITALAGFGHAFFTAILGLLVVFIGLKAENWNEDVFHMIAGCILIAVGIYYLRRQVKGGHSHCCGHSHGETEIQPAFRSDKTVIIGLLAMLTLSPCEGFLPIYLSGIHYGWVGFVGLSIILALATSAGMLFFTWLALTGWERLRLQTLEKYESLILGILLCLLGIIVMTIEHIG